MFQESIRAKVDQDLTRGEEARRQGLEGRARVCARRAAGVAIRAVLEEQGTLKPGLSVIDLLAVVKKLPDLSDRARQAAVWLVEKVDESHNLPGQADLLAEARLLIDELDR